MVGAVDESVGRILAALEEIDATDDTIVVFTSDNGGVVGLADEPRYREGKGYLYEGGIRVPLIVRGPGVQKGLCSEPVHGMDLLPTLLESAGAALPEVDGASLLPLLAEPTRSLGRRSLYWHYPHYHTAGRFPGGAVRAGDLKLIEYYEDGRTELYDLASDPGEQRDLAAERPEVAASLRDQLRTWRASVGAQMPEPNPNHDPAKPFRGGRAAWGAVSPR